MIQTAIVRSNDKIGRIPGFFNSSSALGLDCGPMSGLDADKVNAEFFAGTSLKVNFVCSLGCGDPSKLFSRSPRLSFDQACKII